MASTPQKPRPAGVPEENTYDKMHWTVVIALIVAAISLYFIINAA